MQRHTLIGFLERAYGISQRRACAVMRQSRSGLMYKPVRKILDAPLTQRIEEIAHTRIRYGYQRIHVLLRREGYYSSWVGHNLNLLQTIAAAVAMANRNRL